MDPDEIIAALEGMLAAVQAERDNLRTRVTQMENEVRNGPLNWVRDHPGWSAVMAFFTPIVLIAAVLIFRKVNFTGTVWVAIMAASAMGFAAITYFVATKWQAQHQLDNPPAHP